MAVDILVVSRVLMFLPNGECLWSNTMNLLHGSSSRLRTINQYIFFCKLSTPPLTTLHITMLHSSNISLHFTSTHFISPHYLTTFHLSTPTSSRQRLLDGQTPPACEHLQRNPTYHHRLHHQQHHRLCH